MLFTRSTCILGVVFLLAAGSCKKGADDPAVSLRSRRARLAGEWRMQTGSASLNFSTGYTESYAFDGRSETINTTPGSGAYTLYYYKGTYLLNFKIFDNGTFTMKETEDGNILEAQGNWAFNSGVGAEKKKESVTFCINNVIKGSTTDFHVLNRWGTTFTYHIRELRNKKLSIYSSGTFYSNNTDYINFSSDFNFIQ